MLFYVEVVGATVVLDCTDYPAEVVDDELNVVGAGVVVEPYYNEVVKVDNLVYGVVVTLGS